MSNCIVAVSYCNKKKSTNQFNKFKGVLYKIYSIEVVVVEDTNGSLTMEWIFTFFRVTLLLFNFNAIHFKMNKHSAVL